MIKVCAGVVLAGASLLSSRAAAAPVYGLDIYASAAAFFENTAVTQNYKESNAATSRRHEVIATFTPQNYPPLVTRAGAAADLATGELRAYAAGGRSCRTDSNGTTSCFRDGGYGRAGFHDTLTFAVPDAGPSTRTPVTLTLESEGDIAFGDSPPDVMHIFQGPSGRDRNS